MSDSSLSRQHFVAKQRIFAPIDKVFPLLCPIREYEWIDTWRCRLIYSQSGFAELGCVFSTNNTTDGGEDIWVISRYELNQHIQFVRVNPWRTIRYDLSLSSIANQTAIEWQQEITALSSQGESWLHSLKLDAFQQQIQHLEILLNRFLQDGAN